MFTFILCYNIHRQDVDRLLRKPLYRRYTKYIVGDVLQNKDLRRAGVRTARAVFLVAER
jgi:hypothetical protein